MPVIYEVTLEIAPKLEAAYAEWLPPHIKEVLATGCFSQARRYRIEGAAGEPIRWTTHYLALSRQDLERYLKEHAPRLRQHGLDRFGADFIPSRRILHPHP
jgi:hypothetical protein